MPIKSVLVPLDGGEAGQTALAAAYRVATTHSAHIEVFHVQADSKEAVPLLGEGMSGAMIEEMIDLADRDASERSRAAKRIYDEFRAANDIPVVDEGPAPEGASISWRQEVGREDEVVAYRGRRTDLIVVGRPPAEVDRPVMMTLHAAIFETTKPVLLAPPAVPEALGKKIAIAWNGSMQAARAVSNAIPFLTQADEVVIAAVATEKTAERLRGRELASHLAWHGVNVRRQEVVQDGQTVGQAILQMCAGESIDLLVTGAYTHSRMIQIILGGVTRHVIENAEIPVVMSH